MSHSHSHSHSHAAGKEAAGSAEIAWLGAPVARGYKDITAEVDRSGVDLLNSDDPATILVDLKEPAGLGETEGAGPGKKDCVSSSTDKQLLLFVPFKSVVKLHTIQITSRPTGEDEDGNATEMRPKQIKIFTNHTDNYGFESADELPPVQVIDITPDMWNDKSTVSIPTKFVRFQKVVSITLYFEDGEDEDCEVTRIDRVRFIGQVGESREVQALQDLSKEE